MKEGMAGPKPVEHLLRKEDKPVNEVQDMDDRIKIDQTGRNSAQDVEDDRNSCQDSEMEKG